MKKVAALLCVLFVLVPTCFAEETSDYSYLDGMGIEELMSLRTEIDSRLAQRGAYEVNAIPTGDYIVGIDIKAGTYVATKLFDDGAAVLIIWPDYASKQEYNMGKVIETNNFQIGEPYFFHAEDGQCLQFYGQGLYIINATSDEVKKAWQP